jgi:dihydroorotase
MVARDIILAESLKARVHIAHISTAKSIRMVRDARRAGARVTCEVTPHHFALTEADIDSYNSNYKMKPPLRGHCDVDAAIEGIVDGTIDAIATDHAPHTGNSKMQEFERCPFGVTGLETALGLALERLYHAGKINLTRLVDLFTSGPARVLGLEGGKLAAGGPADITVFSLDREWLFDVNNTLSKSKNSPFDQRRFRGGPSATIVNGKLVWDHQRGLLNGRHNW